MKDEKKKTYEHDPLEKIYKSLGLMSAQIEGLKQGVSAELAALSGLIGHTATRVEQLIYILEQDKVIDEAKMKNAYHQLQEHRLHLERILNESLPMEEKIKEVLKWNTEPVNVKMDMQQISVMEYLFQNPDKLPNDDRKRLAKLAELEEIELQMLEAHFKREKEQSPPEEGPPVAGKR